MNSNVREWRRAMRWGGAALLGAAAAWALVGCSDAGSMGGEETEQAAQPLRSKRPRVLAPKRRDSARQPGSRADTLVVKFVEGSRVRLRGKRFAIERAQRTPSDVERLGRSKLDATLADTQLTAINDLLSAEGSARITRVFQRPEAELDAEQVDLETQGDEELADLNLYYHVQIAPDRAEALLAGLQASELIENAYNAPEPVFSAPVQDTPPTSPPFSVFQGYQYPAAQHGIDAHYAWTVPGGTGTGVRIIDIESGWNTAHEDLPAPFVRHGVSCETVLDGSNSSVQHGTAVLGEMVAANNGYGATGTSYGATYGLSSPYDICGIFANVPLAIDRAASSLRAGDVILIEVHYPFFVDPAAVCTCNCSQFGYVPVETLQLEFDAIKRATAKGIVVVEAAGNGSMNLDSPFYNGLFARSRDSGAIMVGAGVSQTQAPSCFTNYGSRVDVQAWGDSVVTTGYGGSSPCGASVGGPNDPNQFYTVCFSGTSSASPIVASAVANVQGNRRARGLAPFNSPVMRALLTGTGTFPNPPNAKNIGPLPNVKTLLTSVFNN